MTWEPLSLPYICDRIIAFSIPSGNELWLLSYDGLHHVSLAAPVSIQIYKDLPEHHQAISNDGRLEIQGRRLTMLGLHGGKPIHELASGERLVFDNAFERFAVLDATGATTEFDQDLDLPQDWLFGTFAADGLYLVLGTPNNLLVYRRTL